MSKEPNNIDRLIREKLDGFEMAPPTSVWESTSSALATGRKRRFFLWMLVALSTLGLLAVGMYFFVLDDERLVVAQNEQQQTTESHQHEQSMGSKPINSQSLNGKKVESGSSENSDEQNDSSIRSNEYSSSNQTGANELRSEKSNSQIAKAGMSETTAGRSGRDSNKEKDSNVFGKHTDTKSSASSGGEKGRTHSEGATTPPTGLTTEQGTDKTASSTDKHSTVTPPEKEGSPTILSGQSVPDSSYLAPNKLPLNPAQLISQPSGSLVFRNSEEELPAVKSPIWKAFSLEASFGASTFKNVPSSKLTDPSIASVVNNAATNQFSWDARFGLNYHFTDRFSFGSGIHYNASRENYTYKSEEITTYTIVDSITFTVDTSTWDTTYITHTSTYDSSAITSSVSQNTYTIFTLPFQFSWTQPISPRSALEFSLGGAVSIFGKNTGVVLPDTSNFAINAQEGYHTSGMLSLGGSVKYLYRFGNHHSVYVEPWLQLGVTNQSTPALNYESLRRRYGIRIGYRFYF